MMSKYIKLLRFLPLSGIISCYSAIAALVIVGFNHGTAQYEGPAKSTSDYTPTLFVTGAVLSLLFSVLWIQSFTVLSEFTRGRKEYKAKKLDTAPSLDDLKYGKIPNRAILCADRCAGNLLEQLIPFFVSMYAYATFVDAGGAARIGWAWFFFRSYYSFVWKQGIPLLLVSTVPAYTCVWYMMGVTIYSAATA